MPRQPRIQGEYQHIIVRGIGKQILFENDSDREKFLYFLRKYRTELNITVMAYCLMENHVHLLLHSTESSVPAFMKKLGVSYAQYYNRKYERSGHLFQDRYKSENITDEGYLLTVFRYILNNPVKAGICAAEKYPWSSYCEYGKDNGISDTRMLCDMLGSGEAFRQFMLQEDGADCMEAGNNKKDDKWAQSVIQRTLRIESGTQLQQFDREDRDRALIILRQRGLTVRQIERLTGINRGVIQRVSGDGSD